MLNSLRRRNLSAIPQNKVSVLASTKKNANFVNNLPKPSAFETKVAASEQIITKQNPELSEKIEVNHNEILHQLLVEANRHSRSIDINSQQRFYSLFEEIKSVIEKGADPNYQLSSEEGGFFPLLAAILTKKTENVHFIIQQGARLDLKDSEGNNIIHIASRLKGNVFLFFYLTYLADCDEQSRELLYQYNSAKIPSQAIDFVVANKFNNALHLEGMKKLIALTFLSVDHQNKLKSSASSILIASFEDQTLDRKMCEYISNFALSFGVNSLMNSNHHISRETFQILRLLEEKFEINERFSESFSFLELKILDDLTEIRLKNLEAMVTDENLITNDFSIDHALFSTYDFLSRFESNQPYFAELLTHAEKLLKLNANPNYTIIYSKFGNNVPLIFYSCHSFDHAILLENLLNSGANVKTKFENQDILFFNAKKRNYQSIQVILDKKPDIFSILESSGSNSLLYALENRDFELARILINHSERQNPENRINYQITNSKNFDAIDLIFSAIKRGDISKDFFTFNQLSERIAQEEEKAEKERQKLIKEALRNPNSLNLAKLINFTQIDELFSLESPQKKKAFAIILELGEPANVEMFCQKILSNIHDLNSDLASQILLFACNNKNSETLKIVLKQQFIDFENSCSQLKKLAQDGNLQKFNAILNDENFIHKAQTTEKAILKHEIAAIRNSNKSRNSEKFKKLISDFEAKSSEARESKVSEEKPAPKLSKTAVKKLKAQQRAQQEIAATAEIKIREEIRTTKKNYQNLLEELHSAGPFQKSEMQEFLQGNREISTIQDLPKFLQPIINDFLHNGSQVNLKGSAIYQNSSSKKPNDLDMEIIIPRISQKTAPEILEIICRKFSLEAESFQFHFDGNSNYLNSQGDEIRIFNNPHKQIFTVNFKSRSKLIDVSIYDSDLPPTPYLSWNSSIDAKRLQIVDSGIVIPTFVDHFLESQRTRNSAVNSMDDFIINPNSHSLILRLALIITVDLVDISAVQKAIYDNKIEVLDLLKKELKFDNRNREKYAKTICQERLNNFLQHHNFDENSKNKFLNILQNLVENEIHDHKEEKFSQILAEILNPKTKAHHSDILPQPDQISFSIKPSEIKQLASKSERNFSVTKS